MIEVVATLAIHFLVVITLQCHTGILYCVVLITNTRRDILCGKFWRLKIPRPLLSALHHQYMYIQHSRGEWSGSRETKLPLFGYGSQDQITSLWLLSTMDIVKGRPPPQHWRTRQLDSARRKENEKNVNRKRQWNAKLRNPCTNQYRLVQPGEHCINVTAVQVQWQ